LSEVGTGSREENATKQKTSAHDPSNMIMRGQNAPHSDPAAHFRS
jgi:hypothetical protein